jgi:hypothetical protein
LEFWAVRADLAGGNIETVVNSAGGEGTIPAVTVSGFAESYQCAAAMNAGPFSPVSDRTGEERVLTGIFISEGILVSPPNPRYDCLVFYDDRAAVLPQGSLYGNSRLAGIRQALGGFYALLKDGFLTERSASNVKIRHPRSAAGVGGDGRTLYLLVIDGRRIGSIGATEQETALLLRALGASDGILMDGGGSSALALETDGAVRLANRPVHGGLVGRERAVATCIGLRCKAVVSNFTFTMDNPLRHTLKSAGPVSRKNRGPGGGFHSMQSPPTMPKAIAFGTALPGGPHPHFFADTRNF